LLAFKMKTNELSLTEPLQKALDDLGFSEFTAIQEMTLPPSLRVTGRFSRSPDRNRQDRRLCDPDALEPAI
jgi:hypothetical protein